MSPIFVHLLGSPKLVSLNVKVFYAIQISDIFACFYCLNCRLHKAIFMFIV